MERKAYPHDQDTFSKFVHNSLIRVYTAWIHKISIKLTVNYRFFIRYSYNGSFKEPSFFGVHNFCCPRQGRGVKFIVIVTSHLKQIVTLFPVLIMKYLDQCFELIDASVILQA